MGWDVSSAIRLRLPYFRGGNSHGNGNIGNNGNDGNAGGASRQP